MAIIYQKAPEEGRQIAYEKVERVLKAFPNAYKGLKIKELKIGHPHRMYSIGLSEFASSKLLSSARFAGWRYLVTHDAVAVAEVPLTISPKDGHLSKRGGVFGGKLAQATVEALQKAEGLTQTKDENYECRYLVYNTISFYAIWLHGKMDDLIIPLPPTYKRMNAYQPYSESEIVQFLRSDARKALKRGSGGVKLRTPSDRRGQK